MLSDWLVARVTAEAGQSFLDKMIAMVESAARKKTPNEQALELLLIALTLVFLAVSLSLYLFGAFTAAQHGAGNPLGSPRWWRCSCAWRLPPSARCCPLSALPA